MAAAQAFLDSLGLSAHLAAFQQNGFTDSTQLANLTEADLDKMKITKKKERKAILKEAKKIKQKGGAAPVTAASATAVLSTAGSAANVIVTSVPVMKKRKGKASAKQLAPNASSQTDEVSDVRGDTSNALKTTSKAEVEKLLVRAREANASLSLIWKRVSKDTDVEEFTDVTSLVQLTLTKLEEIGNPTVLLHQKLQQFAVDLEEFHRQVQSIGNTKKLLDNLNSSRRNPLSLRNAQVSGNLKWLLMAAGTSPQVEAHLQEIQALKNQSTMRISVAEGQEFWEDHFHELDMDMVPWDRFIAAFQICTTKSLDIHSELMLKHILDNRNLGIVRPQDFSNFLKCFGPLKDAVNNVKTIYSHKWFHGFLSMDEVIHHLSDQPAGTFLVRFPRSKGDSFALEYVEDRGKVRTVLIENDMPRGVFITEENDMKKKFTDVMQLIQHYSDTLKFPFHSDLLHKEWFVGDVSTVEADSMLSGRPPGTFMIRLETGLFQYACSYVAPQGGKGNVKHVFIKKVPSGYVVETAKIGDAKKDEAAASASPVIYPSIQAFVKAWQGNLRYNWDTENVPTVALADFCEKTDPVILKGPGIVDGQGKTFDFACKVAAQTVATYPQKTLGYDVVCDQYLVKVLGNRIVFALADGCNWGARPREAAMRATESIIDQLGDKLVQQQIRDTLDCKHFLLRAFSVAHEAILAGKDDPWSAGTTTLMAGVIAEIDEATNEHVVVLVSVGDCKCYLYRQESDASYCVDVTEGNRRNLRDARDCGGRLGPALDGALPDLRNLSSYFWPLKSGDIIFAVSDGVHDNLDPESIGYEPHELLPELTASSAPESLRKAVASAKTWDALAPREIEQLKTWSMCHTMRTILAKSKERNALSFVQDLVKYAVNTTSANRTFMEQNPALPEPSDHKKYPGKMDHTTCIGMTIGPLFAKDKLVRHRRHSPSMSEGSASAPAQPIGAAPTAQVADKNSKKDDKDKKKDRKFVTKRDKDKSAKGGNGASSPTAAGGKTSGRVEDLKEEASAHSRHNNPNTDREDFTSDSVSKFQTLTSKMRTSLSSLKKPGIFETMAPKFIAELGKVEVLKPPTDLDFDKLHYGPTAKDEEKSAGSMASGWSRSTFPSVVGDDGKQVRYNDPNTTHWSVAMLPHRFLFATTAGGSWRQATASHTASFHACSAFVQSLYSGRGELVNLNQIGYNLMKALDAAQDTIMGASANPDEVGSAVLLGGAAVKTAENKWNVVMANVGNCKAFVWSPVTGNVRDLTQGNTSRDRADAGGKLGNAGDGKPDIRNLGIYSGQLEEGDLMILLSPGAYHNLDPELIGRSPFDLNLTADANAEWSSIKDPEPAKDKFRCEKLEELLETTAFKAAPNDMAKTITNTIGIHCMNLTSPTRSFMESNRSAKEPTDHLKYPGKMGHVSILTFRVGAVPKVEASKDAAVPQLLSTLFSPMRAPDK